MYFAWEQMFGNRTRETVDNPTSGLVKLLQQINCDIPKLAHPQYPDQLKAKTTASPKQL